MEAARRRPHGRDGSRSVFGETRGIGLALACRGALSVHAIDAAKVPDSPCWVIDMEALEANLALLASVQERAGCKILLALKGFAAWSTFGLVGHYLAGAAASTPHEARLVREEMGGEVHACAPAYAAEDVA